MNSKAKKGRKEERVGVFFSTSFSHSQIHSQVEKIEAPNRILGYGYKVYSICYTKQIHCM